MNKLFCIDIDGTLLKNNGKVSNQTLEIIKDIQKQGNIVVLCTARSRKSAIEISKMVKSSDYVISSNGAEIYNYMENKLIYINSIKHSLAKELWSECNGNNIKLSLAIDNDEYVNTKFWNEQKKNKRYKWICVKFLDTFFGKMCSTVFKFIPIPLFVMGPQQSFIT